MMTGKGPHVRHVHSAIRPNCSGNSSGFPEPYLQFLHAIIAVLVITDPERLRPYCICFHPGSLNPALSGWLASLVSYPVRLVLSSSACCLQRTASQSAVFRYFPHYLWGDTEQLKGHSGRLAFKMVSAALRKGWQPPCGALRLNALLLVVLGGLIVHPLAELAHRSQGWRDIKR